MFSPARISLRAFRMIPRCNFSSSNQVERLGPEYDRREFDAYKYEWEKSQSHLGYTPEELFGTRYGLKHSEAIRKEMKKDSIMLVLGLLFVGAFYFRSRQSKNEENEAWEVYVHRNMGSVRAIPKHARPQDYSV